MSIKDSGKRQQMPGMVRDVTDDKIDYSLALDGPLFDRLARHLTEGAKKYSKRNWMGAHTQEEYERFRESAIRHFVQYLRGDTDEDHFAAIAFNLNGMEYVRLKLKGKPQERRIGDDDRRKCRGGSFHTRRRVYFGRRFTDKVDFTLLPLCSTQRMIK